MNPPDDLTIVRAPSLEETAMKTGALNSDVSKDTEAICIDGARGDVARIQNGRGTLVSVQHGTVWITQSGSAKDAYLTRRVVLHRSQRPDTRERPGRHPAGACSAHAVESHCAVGHARLASSFSRLRAPGRSSAGLI